jgi:hypothetical protein
MNNYFSLSSTNNNNNNNVQQIYETDYNRGNFRLTNTDSSFLPTSHFEQYQSTNDYFFPTSNVPSSAFSMSVTNPMLYYTHPWMRPGRNKTTH